MLSAIYFLLDNLIGLYIWAVIAAVVISMLISFGVVNARSQFVYTVADFLDRLTAPALNPIRRALPNFGNIDISPVILILLLEALQIFVTHFFGWLAANGYGF